MGILHKLRFWIRWTAGGFTAAVLLVIGALFLVDLSRLRAPIEAGASALLAREVTISGDLRLLAGMPPTLVLDDVRVANPQWASAAELASVEQLHIALDIRRLLGGRLAPARIRLRGVTLNLEKDANGIGSWPVSADARPVGLPFRELLVDDAVVHYRDESFRTSFTLETLQGQFDPQQDARIDTVLVASGRRATITLSAPLRPSVSPAGPAWPFQLSLLTDAARAGASGEWRGFAGPGSGLREVSARVRVEADSLSALGELAGRQLPDSGRVDVSARVDYAGGALRVSELVATLGDNTLEGNIGLTVATGEPRLQAAIRAVELRLPLGDPAHRRAPDWRALRLPGIAPGTLSAEIVAEVEHLLLDGVDIGAIHAKLNAASGGIGTEPLQPGSPAAQQQALGVLDHPAGVPRMTLSVDTGQLELSPLLAQLGVDLGAPADAYAARVALASSASGDTLGALLDTLSGELRIDEVTLGGERRAVSRRLAIDTLSLSADRGRLSGLSASGEYAGAAFELEGTSSVAILAADPQPPTPFSVQARSAGTTLSIEGTLEHPAKLPRLDARFTVEGDALNTGLPVAADAPRLRFTASGRVRGDTGDASLEELSARVGGSDISGRLRRVTDDGRARISGEIQSERLNLAELRPVVLALLAAASDADSDAADPTTDMNDHTLDVAVRVAEIGGLTVALSDLATHIKSRPGALLLSPLTLSVEGARLRGEAQVLGRTTPPGALAPKQISSTPISLQLLAKLRAEQLDIARLSALAGQRLPFTATTERLELEVSTPLVAAATFPEQLSARLLTYGSNLRQGSAGLLGTLRVERAEASIEPGQALRLRLLGERGGQAFALDVAAGPPGGPGLADAWPVKAALTSGDLTAKLSGSLAGVSSLFSDPRQLRPSLDVSFRSTDAASLARRLGVEPGAIEVLEVTGRVTALNDAVEVDDLRVKLDEQQIDGRARVDKAGKRVSVRATLMSTALDLDRLIGTRKQASESPRLIPDLPLNPGTPRALDVRATLALGRGRLREYVLEDIDVDLAVKNGQLTGVQLRGRLPSGGDTRMHLRLREQRGRPFAALDAAADAIDVGWLLPARASGEVPVWPADVTMVLEGPGESLRQLLADGRGRIDFAAAGTTSKEAELVRFETDLLRLMLPQIGDKPRDRLNCLVARFEVSNGVAKSRGILFDTSHVTVAGDGSVDLDSEQLDLVLTPKPKDRLFSIATPVRLSGTLDTPRFAAAPKDLAVTTGKLLLSTVNPLALFATLATSGAHDQNRCEMALAALNGDVEGEVEAVEPAAPGLLGNVKKAIDGVGKALGGLIGAEPRAGSAADPSAAD